jgi:protein phosphatase
MTLFLHPLAHSEIGLVRKNNQDSGYVSETMLLVADGMGGAAAGDLASAVAARELAKADKATGDPTDRLEDAMTRANDVLTDIITADPSLDGMGTTVCGGIFDGTTLWIAHIGDSRGYLYRDGTLTRITHDHSYVQSLIDDGKLDETEALTHPNRSLLLRVLNGQAYTEPEFSSVDLEAGDRVMFCSDGLCGLVPDEAIEALLSIPNAETAFTPNGTLKDPRKQAAAQSLAATLANFTRRLG